ncbi:hypothetical protein AB1Y20_010272 [Prymnesium parvum]|uniref:Intraflagellar transport protein 122 homolog n=1 Tax=Prymnesium parvum TaxID=97485 RepID=A0AB34K4D8_PRYPA
MAYKSLANFDVIPCMPNLVRGQPTSLKCSPDGKKLLYGLGRTVVIRDIEPSGGMIKAQLYTQHQYEVTAAAMAPSGCYVATGDKTGKLRIWACDNPEQILKLESEMFGGAILDIAWSPDNSRVCAVGDGREVYGKVIMWDSGNSVGDVSGHTKKVNSCSFKSTRPFRICTGGEDGLVNFYEGPPFKFKVCASRHTNFVNVVRYSPNGNYFFSVSNDMMVKIYDGKEGTMLKEIKPHAGSIYGACWSADSTQIVTCSGDKSVKVFKVADGGDITEMASCSLGKTPDFMQVGCVWAGPLILSYGLGGALTMFSEDCKVVATQYGHNRPIATLAMSNGKLLSGSFEDAISPIGSIRSWDLSTGLATPFTAADGTQKGGHASMVMKIGVRSNGEIVSIGRDDSMLISSADGIYQTKTQLEAAPCDMSCGGSLVAIVTVTKELKLSSSSAIDVVVPVRFEPTCVAVSPDDTCVAVGATDRAVHVFDGRGVHKFTMIERHRDAISCVAYSPDSMLLASGCANKELVIWDAKEGSALITGLQGFHTTRIACLAWSSTGTLVSGGVDSCIFVWTKETLKEKKPYATAKLTHTGGGVNALQFITEDTFASAGADACIKLWKL